MAAPAVPQYPHLDGWEMGWPLRAGWPWWLHLLVFGHGAPIPDIEVQEMKDGWFDTSTDDATRKAMLTELQQRFKERQSSTLDTFVKLTIIAALIVVVPQTAHEILGAVGTKGSAWVWASLALIFCALVCTLLMITSKLKVWKRQNKSRPSVGLEIVRRRDLKGWPEYLRLARKLRHRQQLIKLERRLLGLTSVLIISAFATWIMALQGV
ncbi:MAG TPA: hypothetical protein VM581_03920 [Magnetospirillaceae bacterium]|nr:hypothetical protein [Magnetospirillaceae bacterium]